MDIPILYEDNELLVINKPAGIIVNRAESVKSLTVQDWVEANIEYRKAESQNFDKDFVGRAGIVHRIDKETSGLLLVAKTPEAFFELQRQFKERTVKKTYLAIVHGQLVPEDGEIRAPVGRLPWSRERFGITPGGREAVTKYKVHGLPFTAYGKELTLVELYPETGRTHQLRVHLKYINHPIVSDYLYAGRKVNNDDRKWFPRVLLHAWKISFQHPITSDRLAFEAPIPDDMIKVIDPINLTNFFNKTTKS